MFCCFGGCFSFGFGRFRLRRDGPKGSPNPSFLGGFVGSFSLVFCLVSSEPNEGNFPAILQGFGFFSQSPFLQMLLFLSFFFCFFLCFFFSFSLSIFHIFFLLENAFSNYSCYFFLIISIFFHVSFLVFASFFRNSFLKPHFFKLMLLSFFGWFLLLCLFLLLVVVHLKTPCWSKFRVATKRCFFRSPCFQKCEKLVLFVSDCLFCPFSSAFL